ncbi:1-phosphatidylinositol 4,5-bisphosphate phosphodiesterase delta-3-A-like [Polypterus senegalus]|uniref:1-phosphatidylinositol 4,5-bisphosphate phosphodiesterase delta-3-A-like n=1 Tax=Polypterus senegalus TaxID=55291 RepID=UPI001964D641|nr:1-phosphatidylinositol 4,5-bisphosphate phosphodiesterase delta-3-A-like [Polypterus senegalus]
MTHSNRSRAYEVDGAADGSRALRKLGLTEDEDVRFMLRGSALMKIRSARWQKKRTIQLLEDGMTVWCETKKQSRRAQSQQTFSVMEMESVREGCQSEVLRGLSSAVYDKLCFTVTFKGKRKNLDLLCGTEEEARHWVGGLRKLRAKGEAMNQRDKLEHWIYGYLQKADVNKDNKMSFKEVKSLLKMINIEMDDDYASRLFKECDGSKNNRLEGREIAEFCRRLMRRPELEDVFRRYSGEDCVLSDEELLEFLRDQGEEATLSRARRLIQQYELNEKAKKHQMMMLDGFTMYLLSKEGDIMESTHSELHQDMRQPLAHYYISSSHNTYLMEDQFGGPSSTEAYIRALSRGCRCVELDCWEGPNGEPVVYHGHTLTSKILFKDVIRTIKEYAFTASQFPLILSLENHCGVEQQQVMAGHLRGILGKALLTKPLDTPPCQKLPSPQDLRGRILIKGKKQAEKPTDAETSSNSSSSSEDDEDEVDSSQYKKKGKRKMSKTPPLPPNGSNKAGTSQLAPELSELIVYCRSTRFRGFDQSLLRPADEITSFSEGKARRLVRSSGGHFVQHNSRQLSRIYPSGLRAHSSNYNPQEMWNVGCQIVALNFQTPGAEMDLNQGRFQQNGNSGYVLKPEFLRGRDVTFDPEHPARGPGHNPKQLVITVISAQQLPKLNKDKPNSIVDPLVRVEVHGVSMDNAKASTAYITNNGFNPQWKTPLTFNVRVPDLALVRFVVEDYDLTSSNDFVGQYTMPFSSLRQGYRHIHLLSADGATISPATLFVHVKVTDP